MLELIASLGVLALLASALAPGLAKTRVAGAATRCQNNLRQLTQAWQMYAEDNQGQLAPNSAAGGQGASTAAWVAGWLDYSSNSDNTNTALLIDHARYPYGAYLGPYLKTPSPFRCPADMSTALIAGQRLPRVRSVSMSNYVGVGARTWVTPSTSPVFTNLARIPAPAATFVVLDEHPDSINDGTFITDPDTAYHLIDYPAGYHNRGAGISFADGHAEIHRWHDPRTTPILQPGQLIAFNIFMPGNVDVLWLTRHAIGRP